MHTTHHFVLLKVCLVFSRQTSPIHFFRPKTQVHVTFVRYCCRKVPVAKSCVGVHSMHHLVLPKVCLVFLQGTCPSHFFRAKTHVLGGFGGFCSRKVPVAKYGVVVQTMHHFVLPKVCLVFSQCPIHFFRPKTQVLGGFVRFRCRKVPLAKSGVGVHAMHHFVLPMVCLFFRNEYAQSNSLGLKLML